MKLFAFCYWSALFFGAGYWAAKTDMISQVKLDGKDLYDALVDYTAARAAEQRHKSERQLAGAGM